MLNYSIIFSSSVVALLLLNSLVFNPALNDKWFALLWSSSVLVFVLPYGFQIIHTVSLNESGLLVFKSLLYQRAYEAADLRSITTNFGEGYFLFFQFRKVRIAVLNDVRNRSELLLRLKKINPTVKTDGIPF